MNIHHLELFYYVAKHGGIAAAVRKMPYGIQQPAVSGQIASLEEALGAKLFNRRPFSLLPAGAELFEFIKPFFDDVDKVAGRIRGASLQLRIAAPSVVLYDYVPELLQRVRRRSPSFRLQLHEAVGADAERLLLAGDTDLAITILDGKRRPEIHSRPLLELPLILLVNKKQNITHARQLWARDKIEETLITFPRGDSVQSHFQRGLEQLGVEWFPGIEVNSTRLIEHYVANGYGIGLTVAAPGFQIAAGSACGLIAGDSAGDCRSRLGRKTIPNCATIRRRSRNRSQRRKTQHEIALTLRPVGALKCARARS